MQTRTFVGPFIDRNPDFSGIAWAIYGTTQSHVDSSDASGYLASNVDGGESLAHVMVLDDATIPALSKVQRVRLTFRLGQDALSTQGSLPVVPYIRYDGGAPTFQDQIVPVHAASFADHVVEFPRDPDGMPWTRASIYRKRGKLLVFGLQSKQVDLVTAQVQWSECRFAVDFDLPVPIVVTDPASLISAAAALLNGRLNPQSANGSYPLTYWFEYGTTTAYGSQTLPAAGVTGELDVAVTAMISGLDTDVGYHFRLAASNADGTYYGEDQFFTTDPTAIGRFRLDEYKRIATGEWLPGDRTRLTSVGFDRPGTSTDDLSCPFLEYP